MPVIAIGTPIDGGAIVQKRTFGFAALSASAANAANAAVADTGYAQTFEPTLQPEGGTADIGHALALVCTPTGTATNLQAVSVVVTGIALVDGVGVPTTETLPAFSSGATTAKTSVNVWQSISAITQPALGATPGTSIPCNIEYGYAALAGAPALGSGLTFQAAADTGVTQVLAPTAQPDVPRCIVATPSGTTANVTAVSATVVGLGPNGEAITEVLPAFSAGAATAVTSLNAFSVILSISQPAIGTSVTITYTASPKLGLGVSMNTNTVLAAYLNGVKEGTAPTVTLSATPSKALVQLNSALNGTPVRVDFYYPN